MFLPQQILGGRSGQPQASISINSNNPDLAESLGNILQLFSGRNIHVGIVGDSGNPTGSDVTFADLLEHAGIQMNLLSSQDSESEGDLLLDLAVLVVQT